MIMIPPHSGMSSPMQGPLSSPHPIVRYISSSRTETPDSNQSPWTGATKSILYLLDGPRMAFHPDVVCMECLLAAAIASLPDECFPHGIAQECETGCILLGLDVLY